MDPEQLGQAVRCARIEHHWSQEDLAKVTGVSREWVGRMERGAPRLEHDKVLRVIGSLGFSIQAPTSTAGTADEETDTASPGRSLSSPVRRRVSVKSRANMWAELQKGQQLAGHDPSPEALERAKRVAQGELALEEAHAEIDAKFRQTPRARRR